MTKESAHDAEEFYREAIEIRKSLGEQFSLLVSRMFFANTLYNEGKSDEAESMMRQVIAAERTLFGDQDPHQFLVESLNSLAYHLHTQGKYKEAEANYREALAMERKLKNDADPNVAGNLNDLVSVLVDEHKLVEAEQIFASVSLPEAGLSPEHIELFQNCCNLFARHGDWGKAVALAAILIKEDSDNCDSYHALVPLLVENHDLQAYHEICHQIIARFKGATNALVADKMAKDCLILPSAEADLR